MQFICLEMCTYASLKEWMLGRQHILTVFRDQNYKEEKQPKPNSAWSSGANCRLTGRDAQNHQD